ncbi:MAG: hypothetical protein AB1333_03280 [Patescibacteria group bacterium]
MRAISSFIIFSFLFGVCVYAPVNAQSDTTKKALESVKESVTTLINAKDEENPNDIAFRIETFKKVIDFSIAEAKDLKIKLFGIDTKKVGTSTVAWKNGVMKDIDEALEYYDSEKNFIKEGEASLTLIEVKTRAESFKEWRESKYAPTADEINTYFLIEQQKQALETTKKRTEKIHLDIEKLKKAKIKTSGLEKLFSKVDPMIKDAEELNNRADLLFYKTKILPQPPKEEVINETTTNEIINTTTSTVVSEIEKNPELSIKDLVKESFAKVKNIYQIFIDMSGLVRKLL